MKSAMVILLTALGFLLSANESGNLINVSWGDNIMVGTGISKLDTPEKIREALKVWQEYYDGQTILWRISSEYLKRFYDRRRSPFQVEYDAKVDAVAKTFDPAKLVREETRRLGQKFLLYATFLDHGAPVTELCSGTIPFPWQDRVTIEHPEYQEKDLRGNYHYGVLDLSEPEARKFMIKRLIDFVHEYDADGLYLCSRTHSVPALHADQFGFGPNVVAEYKKRYGIDIAKDPRFDWKSDKFAPHSPEVENWRRLRGEYLTVFLQELRAALKGKLLYAGLPAGDYFSAPYGNMYIDTKDIIRRHLVDGLVLGVTSGRWLYSLDKTPHKDKGYLLSYDDNFNVPSKEKIAAVFSPLCKQNNVKLFWRSSYNPARDAGFDGRMLDAPNARLSFFIDNNPLFAKDSLSIDGWFFIAKEQGGFSGAPRLISKYNNNQDTERGWELYIDGKTSIPAFRTYLQLPDGTCRDYTLKADRKIAREEWVHLAAVFDREKHENRIYVNGKLAGTLPLPANSKLHDNAGIRVMFGNYAGCWQDVRMKVDELRIGSLPLTFSEAPQAPYTGKEPGTLALFHFDSPKKAADILAPGLKLQFIGTPSTVPGHFGDCMNMLE